jgi:hypothetical protein
MVFELLVFFTVTVYVAKISEPPLLKETAVASSVFGSTTAVSSPPNAEPAIKDATRAAIDGRVAARSR